MFFPPKENLALGNEAILICFGCPVRAECNQWKKDTKTQHGIWAGVPIKRGKK